MTTIKLVPKQVVEAMYRWSFGTERFNDPAGNERYLDFGWEELLAVYYDFDDAAWHRFQNADKMGIGDWT